MRQKKYRPTDEGQFRVQDNWKTKERRQSTARWKHKENDLIKRKYKTFEKIDKQQTWRKKA